MNFYILDNDSKIIHLLSNIIENDFNNTVVGTTSNPQQAYDDAMRLGIDIMFIDYAMPAMDGVQLIQKIQDSHHYPHFIMTAQAILPSVKTSAYQHGIDFFIEKPLNIAEVKSVIKLAAQNINMSNRLLQVLDLVSGAATNNNTVTISGKNKKKEFCLEMAYCHQTVTNWPFFHQSKEKVLYIKDFIDFGAEEEI